MPNSGGRKAPVAGFLAGRLVYGGAMCGAPGKRAGQGYVLGESPPLVVG